MSARPGRALAALVAGGALAHSAPAAAAVNAPTRSALRIRSTVASAHAVALTFDDGPHPEGTPAVLAQLAEAGARATFFLVGEQVERHPGYVAEIVAGGHEVGLHGHTHRGHLRLFPAQVADDLHRGREVLGEALGRAPTLHRPPYGVYSAASLALARRAGLEPVLWSRHGRDWSPRASARSIAERLGRRIRAGEILLLHDADHYGSPDSWRRTAAALPLVLARLRDEGLEARPA